MEKVHYEGIDIVTNGYKVVIMDFDKSFINVDQIQAIQYFLSNLYNLLSRIKFDLKDKITAIKNFDNIILFISNAEVHKYDITKAVDLPKMIDDIIFVDSEPLTVPTYNPNITG
jgi:hypothetical protein